MEGLWGGVWGISLVKLGRIFFVGERERRTDVDFYQMRKPHHHNHSYSFNHK